MSDAIGISGEDVVHLLQHPVVESMFVVDEICPVAARIFRVAILDVGSAKILLRLFSHVADGLRLTGTLLAGLQHAAAVVGGSGGTGHGLLLYVEDKRLGDEQRLHAELERGRHLQVETSISHGSRTVAGLVGSGFVHLVFHGLLHLVAIHASTHQAGEVVVREVGRLEQQPAILVVGHDLGHVVA